MADFQNRVLVAHVTETTKSAGRSKPGTVIATKRGDWVWWVASVALIALVVYAVYHPNILRVMFA